MNEQNFQARIDKFNEFMKEFLIELAEVKSSANNHVRNMEVANMIQYVPGDSVWVIDAEHFDSDLKKLTSDKFYFRDRESNPDNLKVENQLRIERVPVRTIAYGKNPKDERFRFHGSDDVDRWYYNATSYGAKWVTARLIAGSKQELIDRFSKEYEDLKDQYFASKAAKEKADKQAKIEAAKKVLSDAGLPS